MRVRPQWNLLVTWWRHWVDHEERELVVEQHRHTLCSCSTEYHKSIILLSKYAAINRQPSFPSRSVLLSIMFTALWPYLDAHTLLPPTHCFLPTWKAPRNSESPSSISWRTDWRTSRRVAVEHLVFRLKGSRRKREMNQTFVSAFVSIASKVWWAKPISSEIAVQPRDYNYAYR